MTQNKRIFLNVVATYGRSLYALVCGLFTARWALMALGDLNYGLLGVVGGIVGFVSYFNHLMSSAVSRYYAFSVGQSYTAKNSEEALQECRRWFNVAVMIHSVIPLVSVIIGYPIGEWAVRNYLTIPPDRVEACVWVFRISCLGCLVNMMTVPYYAMYRAKQEISELTIYGFVTTTLNVMFLSYMVTHVGDWLVKYAGWTAFLSIAPSLIVSLRSFVKYPECRYNVRYMFDWSRALQMFRYAGCRFLSTLATLSSRQGMTILVNKMLGPSQNAAMTIGNSVCGHAMTLLGAMRGAFTPAITNAAGAGDKSRVEDLACRASVFCALSIAVFAIPIVLEIDEVLILWLKTPPTKTAVLVQMLLVASAIDSMAFGQCLSILSYERIGLYQLCEALLYLIPLPMAYFVFNRGGGLEGVGYGFIVLYTLDNISKLLFVRHLCGHSIRRWIRSVCVPVLLVVGASTCAALIPRMCLEASFSRVALTSVVSSLVFLPSVWFFILLPSDREKFIKAVRKVLRPAR